MALGIFIIFISACGAGVIAFFFFFLARVAWKKGKKVVAAILAGIGAVCAAFAVYMASFLPEALDFMIHF